MTSKIHLVLFVFLQYQVYNGHAYYICDSIRSERQPANPETQNTLVWAKNHPSKRAYVKIMMNGDDL